MAFWLLGVPPNYWDKSLEDRESPLSQPFKLCLVIQQNEQQKLLLGDVFLN